MLRFRLVVLSAIALVTAVILLVAQALIGLNFALEGDPLPTYLRVMQWLGLGLAAVGLGMAIAAVVLSFRRNG